MSDSMMITSVVALYMSAWIEIFSGTKKTKRFLVALYMSAWIEISRYALPSFLSCVAFYMGATH
ncbi:hypothetical protein WG8_3347 [Paenibacillus sp. Aloe-11]|nr:hypothetical protein WG8_3347 [Paenibacillus sp. Aloe-11]